MKDSHGSARHRGHRRGIVGPLVSAASVVLATAPVVWVMSGAQGATSLSGDDRKDAGDTATQAVDSNRNAPSRGVIGQGTKVTVTSKGGVLTVTTIGGEQVPSTVTTPSAGTTTTTTTAPTPTTGPSTTVTRAVRRTPDPSRNSVSPRPPQRLPTATRTTVDPPPEGGASTNEQERQVLQYTNMVRKEVGCGPVSLDDSLVASSGGHAEDMVDRHFFSHTNPDGLSPYERMERAGFRGRSAAENIAAGYQTAEDVMRAWLKSEGHRANIINCDFNRIGIGYDPGRVKRDFGPGSWVQNFGRVS
jgi:uncharacterized protein YkwD